jgi:hypothetical protein
VERDVAKEVRDEKREAHCFMNVLETRDERQETRDRR